MEAKIFVGGPGLQRRKRHVPLDFFFRVDDWFQTNYVILFPGPRLQQNTGLGGALRFRNAGELLGVHPEHGRAALPRLQQRADKAADLSDVDALQNGRSLP